MKDSLRCLTVLLLMYIGAGSSVPTARADDSLDEFYKKARRELMEFRDKAMAEREAFRDSVLSELSQWLSQPWEPKPLEPPVPMPLDELPVPPVIIPRDEPAPTPREEPVRDNPVIAPEPMPAPEPPQPVLPPAPVAPRPDYFTFTSYGTTYRVDAASGLKAALPAVYESKPSEAVCETVDRIDGELFERLSSSLIRQAGEHNLSDWAFLRLVEHFTGAFVPDNVNAQKMLQGLILTAAGYDVRFGEAPARGRLYVLVGCRELILDEPYYILDGNERYYPREQTPGDGFVIMPVKFNGTRLLTVQPSGKELFDVRSGEPHRVVVCLHEPHCWKKSCHSPATTFSLTGNLNRMEYLSECPVYITPGNDYSRWTTYAQTRLSDEYEKQLYPSLRKALAGMDRLEAANYLMRFVEDFDYKKDSEMWGVADRAFFPDETLHYPYRDCEDGAILFTRLVRDLLGLPAALVYYPGHLAAAVSFDTPVKGAYINAGGRRYTICDPTYYYVGVGVQMPADVVDASQAVLIPLQ